jgi:hypothetical protein
MRGEFIIKKEGELITYTEYDDIPNTFDHVIKFNPDWPEPPHTQEDHDLMEVFNDKLQVLMEIEKNAGSN